MAQRWEDIEHKIRLMNTLLDEIELSVEQVVSKYPDSEFLLRLLGLVDSWTEDDRKILEEKITGTRHHRNHRDARTYAANVVLGWVMQDVVIQQLRKSGYECEPAGADAQRQLLRGHQISEEADLRLQTPAGEIWWLDVLTDYPTQKGALSYWKQTNRCDLRDQKFQRLAEKIKGGDRAGLIGISTGTKSYFGLEITEEIVQELRSPPPRNRRIYRVETHWPFGGKPAITLNLRLLQVPFYPFKNFPAGLPFFTMVKETQLPLPLYTRGKVRDTYALDDALLMITTDRLSAFDVVLPTPIPDKGRVLNGLSAFWFHRFEPWMPHHLISTDWSAIADALQRVGVPDVDAYRPLLIGRTMLVRRAKPFPVECVVRGYLAGSLWKEYLQAGGAQREQPVTLHGIHLPAGLRESERLPEPIFTPATKAHSGHDENISFEQMAHIVGADYARQLRELSLRLYHEAAEYALARGIIIADTKFEFGLDDGGRILLIDEVLTPDSSRFWDAALYQPGRAQPSYDKQFVRDYLESIGWNKQPPAPPLPPDIVQKTADKYREAYRRLTGEPLPPAE